MTLLKYQDAVFYRRLHPSLLKHLKDSAIDFFGLNRLPGLACLFENLWWYVDRKTSPTPKVVLPAPTGPNKSMSFANDRFNWRIEMHLSLFE